MATVVDVLARLRADSSGMTRGFNEAERAAKGFSTKTVAIGSAIGTALGTVVTQAAMAAGRAVVGFVGDSVNAARDINETISKVGVIFGDQAKEIQAFAATAATSMGLSQQAAMDAASTFAVFGKSAGLAGGDLTKFSTDLTGLSSDLASFYNTSPEEAITAIGAALRGESEPIRRYGILLDDASLRQQALSMGIVSTTKNALTPQQRVLAAQAMILKQTSDAQGDFQRTSGGLANQQRILAAQVENVKTVFGQALLPAVLQVTTAFTSKILPAVTEVAQWMQTNLGPAIQNITDRIGKLFSGISGGSGILTLYIGYIKSIGTSFMQNVMPAVESVLPKFQALFEAVGTQVVPIFKELVSFMSGSVVPTIMKVVAAVIEIAGYLAQKLAPIVAKVGDFFRTKLIPTLVDLFKKAQPVIDTVIQLTKDLSKIAATIISFVVPIVLKIAGILVDILKPAFSVVITIIGAVLKVIGGLIHGIANMGKAFDAVKNVAITAFNLMMSGIGSVVNKIIDIFNGLIKAWNMVPFHDDVQLISHVTMPQLQKSVAAVGTSSRTASEHLKSLQTYTKAAAVAADTHTTATNANTTATTANTRATQDNAKAKEEARKKALEAAQGELDAFKAQQGLNKAASSMSTFLTKGIYDTVKSDDAKNAVSDAMQYFGGLVAGYASTITDPLKKVQFELGGEKLGAGLNKSIAQYEDALDRIAQQRKLLAQQIEEAKNTLAAAKQARAEAADTLKDLIKSSFGQPSQIQKALASAEASVESIISTYDSLVATINKRFQGINPAKKDSLISFLQRQTQKLIGLAQERQRVAKEIEKAQQRLDDIISARRDFSNNARDSIKSFNKSFGGFVSDELKVIGEKEMGVDSRGFKVFVQQFGKVGAASANEIVAKFQQRLATVKGFTASIKALAAAGLNKDSIGELIALGPEEGAAVAQSILDGGVGAIAALNSVNAEMDAISTEFGETLATNYYAQAQNQAQAYLDGWKAQEAAITANMNAIATSIIDQLAMITDPMYNLGEDMAQKFLDGLMAQQETLEKAAKKIADTIVTEVKRAMAALDELAAKSGAGTPVVTPAPNPSTSTDSSGNTADNSTNVNKGAVVVNIYGGQDRDYDEKLRQQAAAATKAAMTKALVDAARTASYSRRDR